MEFKRPPRALFTGTEHAPAPNRLRFRFKPDGAITLRVQAKKAGDAVVSRPIDLELVRVADDEAGAHEAYERLIGDALAGEAAFFAHQDTVEAAWRVVEPVLDAVAPMRSYSRGSWGPDAAESLLPGGWHRQ